MHLVSFIVGVSLVAVAGAEAATEVTACAQRVVGDAYLATNLTCTGTGDPAITIAGGTLDLRGFSISAGERTGVLCESSCKLVSEPPGGAVTGTIGRYAIVAQEDLEIVGVSVEANDAAVLVVGDFVCIDSIIRENSSRAIDAWSVDLLRCEVTDNPGPSHSSGGIQGAFIRIVDSQVTGNNGVGVSVINGLAPVTIIGSAISGNGDWGIRAGQAGVEIRDSEINDNAREGISATGRIRVENSEIVGNLANGIYHCCYRGNVTLKDSTVSNNAGVGVYLGDGVLRAIRSEINANFTGLVMPSGFGRCTMRLRHSTAIANTFAGCEGCADLVSCSAPRVRRSTCEVSAVAAAAFFERQTWGVCSRD